MRFGMINVMPAEAPFEDWLRFTRAVEDAGFENVTVPDSQMRVMESTVSLALIAAHTSRIRFGPTISNPTTRHPGVAASSYASLQRVSKGRAFFGIGTGNSAVRGLGLAPAKLDELEAYVRAMRDLFRDGSTTYRGARCSLPWAPGAVPEGVPVYIAANAPRSLELAGRIADGVIVGGGVSPEVIDQSMNYLEQGAKRAGRRLEDIDLWFQAVVFIADSEQEAVDEMKDLLASIASRNFRATFEGKAVPPALQRAIRAMEREYEYEEQGAASGANGRLLDKYGLTEFFAERWLVGGTAQKVIERLKQLESRGICKVHIPGMVPDPFKLLVQIRDEIMPHFANSAGPALTPGPKRSPAQPVR